MAKEEWIEWIKAQLARLIGQTSEYVHGQSDTYERVHERLRHRQYLPFRRFQITTQWLMKKIDEEHRSVLLHSGDPPHRSRLTYYQGRLAAYQQMLILLKSPGHKHDRGDLTTREDSTR
jgi:hypothetical protein